MSKNRSAPAGNDPGDQSRLAAGRLGALEIAMVEAAAAENYEEAARLRNAIQVAK